ncbi:sensor histidine kinase [Geobacillus kaustophilus]|nr:sensor histidine kinase [Geobacillus kaustophilus]
MGAWITLLHNLKKWKGLHLRNTERSRRVPYYKKWLESFHHMRLKNKLTFLYLFAVLIPTTVTNGLFYYVVTNQVRTQKLHDASLVIEQLKKDFEQGIDQVVGISSMLYTDSRINEMLDRQYTSDAEYVQHYHNVFPEFNKYRYMHPFIHSIVFFTDNSTVIFSGSVQPITPQLQQADWYRDIRSFPVLVRTGRSLSIVRKLDYFSFYNKTNRMVRIELEPTAIDHLLRTRAFPGEIYIVDRQGNVQYSTRGQNNDHEGKPPARTEKGRIVISHRYKTAHYLRGWSIVGVVSEEKLVNNTRYFMAFIFWMAFVNFVVPTIILFLVSKPLHARIVNILSYMKKVERGKFETIYSELYDDEIGQLAKAFNRMSLTIKRLIQDVYMANIQKKEMELQKKQAQLNALQSQMNPHFLFNVLETIRMRSLMKHEDETAEMVEHMARILRKSISWGSDWVKVREEMDIVSRLLSIQRYRFGDKLQYKINIDESALEHTIPNMIILPFVENACKHGVESKAGQGTIDIQVRAEGPWLTFTIRDNGPGMNEQQLLQLWRSLNEGEGITEHVGVRNVYYRLKMYYGEHFTFQMYNDRGFVVFLSLPIPDVK